MGHPQRGRVSGGLVAFTTHHSPVTFPHGITEVATVSEVFALAWQHHQAGSLLQAEQLYRQILAADPSHADSLHCIGVLAYQLGRLDQAVVSIRQALSLRPISWQRITPLQWPSPIWANPRRRWTTTTAH